MYIKKKCIKRMVKHMYKNMYKKKKCVFNFHLIYTHFELLWL